eukprot:TRINITY_DN24481_c0_g1_i3.p1 TRINITY_DN24481_c0_g1~~TRINITY_DN24481_c0_g1_i3.p1  ORF type:complete len:228 (+),score=49.84 TRINITY_DN24481_c0_g1_i3:644-1327(+)
MPPKKKLKSDVGQKSLTTFWTPANRASTSSAVDGAAISVSSSENDVISASSEETGGKKRTFVKSWLALFPWLRFTNYAMFCGKCAEAKFVNSFTQDGCTNFRKSALSEHAGTKDHRTAIQVPALQKEREVVHTKQLTRQERGAGVAVKAMHWLVTESLPLSKFSSLMGTMQDLQVPNANELLVSGSTQYESRRSAHEFLEAMSDVVEEDIKKELDSAETVTVLVDER